VVIDSKMVSDLMKHSLPHLLGQATVIWKAPDQGQPEDSDLVRRRQVVARPADRYGNTLVQAVEALSAAQSQTRPFGWPGVAPDDKDHVVEPRGVLSGKDIEGGFHVALDDI